MADPLAICATEERRSVIRLLLSEDINPTEIHRKMQVPYRDSCLWIL